MSPSSSPPPLAFVRLPSELSTQTSPTTPKDSSLFTQSSPAPLCSLLPLPRPQLVERLFPLTTYYSRSDWAPITAPTIIKALCALNDTLPGGPLFHSIYDWITSHLLRTPRPEKEFTKAPS